MIEQLKKIEENSKLDLSKVDSYEKVEEIRVKYLGKKGELTKILKGMGKLEPDKRAEIGKIANNIRNDIEDAISNIKIEIKKKELSSKFESEKIDVSIPSNFEFTGSLHPLTIVERELEDIFSSMGFSVVEGPEIDTIENNFDALNAPKNHPSRDISDTFYLRDDLLLRTQTSTVQVRTMKTQKPPIKIVSPGRCFRCDALDATHSPMFNQLEGLVVDKNISFANFKFTLEVFLKKFFGEDTKVKFRPHNFPFTEPSAEVDISCFKCKGEGCPTCKGEGYIEILGAGMVHPNVLENCGIDPKVYSGFAFGVGLERIAMMKYQIDDIRYFYENDIRFLNQFK